MFETTSERAWLDLTLAQRAVWFDAQLSASPAAYTLVRLARIRGPVDPEAARAALTLIVARHDALRLRVDADAPRQWLHDAPDAPFTLVDLTHADDAEAALRAHVAAAVARPMPFGARPLFALDVLALAPADHAVFLRCHHLLVDEAAVSLILQHWFAAYLALTSDSPVELAPPTSYVAEIASDHAYATSERFAADLAYWKARFANPSPALFTAKLGADDAAEVYAARHDFAGARYQRFVAVAAKAGVTPQRALFALLAVVLGRRYGRTDVTLGMALHRRNAANANVIGMMAGTIAVRLALRDDASLRDTVRAASARIDEDLRHGRLPIDELSRALGLSATGLAGLFQAAVSYLPALRASVAPAADVTFSLEALPSREASALTLHAAEREDGLALDLAARGDVFDAGDAERLMRLLVSALERFADDPGCELERFEVLAPGERETVVTSWNATAVDFACATADALVRKRARREPHACAVAGATGTLTYAELDDRSEVLAARLLACGLPVGAVVGVALERSTATVVALLAILKAGCAYLPLDVTYPPDRLAFMLNDSGATHAITDAAHASLVPSGVVPMRVDEPGADERSDLTGRHGPADTAYVIYTSGSTGTPKGVAVSHAAAVNLAFARAAAHDPIGPGDRVLAAISVGFDVSIGQLLLPLVHGATVVIASDLRSLSAADFWSFLAEHRVTHVNSVPSFFESILDAAPARTSLARLMLGGEPLAPALVRRLLRALPETAVHNMYGPTEACIDATSYRATGHETGAVLPIGTPLPNYRAYVLDARLEPVGIGVAGDLYLGGAGLAHGYVGDPARTAERFVPDPFGGPGSRLYRTGDRARWNASGTLAFLGRDDAQVKIRGHRVELGEIAAALRALPSIATAAVIARTDGAGPARLVAYLVLAAGAPEPEAAWLRAALGERLPDYLIPSAFRTLAALPLTPNGKLDERALPPVVWESNAVVAPRDEREAAVAALFAEVLGVANVGATDHFFELGGHSLLATRLIAQVRVKLGASVPLRTVFDHPTVERFARALDAAAAPAAPRPEALPAAQPPVLSFAQERLWFLSQLGADDAYNVPVAFRIRGAFSTERASDALARIVERHEALRTCVAMRDGAPVAIVRDAATFAVETVDLRGRDAASRERAFDERVRAFARAPFDLENDLPIRIAIVLLADDDRAIVAVAHHAAFDGWSAAAFLAEFALRYAAPLDARAHAVEPLALRYADFAAWQRAQDFTPALAYFRERLAGAPARLAFPVDRVPGAAGRRPARRVTFALDAGAHAALQRVASAHGASLFMVLHAAYAALLARWTGRDDLVIGTVVANRPHAEFEPIVGCFVNTLALRTRVPANATFVELLRAVREDDLAAFEHQGLPFEKLVDALQPERSFAATPLFGAMLVLQDAPPAFALPGASVEPVVVETNVAKFDLSLDLGATAGGGLAGTLEYAADAYDETTMLRFVAQLERLLLAVTIDATARPAALDVLDPAERASLAAWGAPVAAYPTGTLDALFAEQAARTPDALALVDGAERFSYGELRARARAFARALLARGVRRGDVVGVALERSAATVVSFLAILEIGGVYLPLDPSYPAGRLAFMVADAGASLVVTAETIAAPLPADGPRGAAGVSHGEHGPADAAYVIYTSGSTGQPKGVLVSHAAAVNLAFARRAHDPIGPGDRILAAISVGFDVSIGQLLLPLLAGATVVVAGDLRSYTPAAFWAFLTEHGVTHVNSVPSFFESVLDAAPASSPLVRLMLGGEALTTALVRRLRRALPRVAVFNMYGPTEACIDATVAAARPGERGAFVPIGTPLPNDRAYVLDARLERAGIGIVGDLYLAGAGLAHGYLGASALTASRFLADPFGAPGERMYATGDRARWNADGQLEFFGRADTQVKLRGHRIELGEIEAGLLACPGIREAVAIVREDAPGDPRLVAYYTSDDALPAEALREALLAGLPAYMVPAAYVRLDALPLTTNGKIDRRAFPAPGAEAYPVRAFAPPVGTAEMRVAAAFAHVLGLDQPGRDDHFFERGGHSLLAMAVIERLRADGLHVDVRDLFTSPTVAGLAARASDASRRVHVPPNRIPADATAIVPGMLPLVTLTEREIDAIVARVPGGAANVKDVYPLAPLQEGMLFHHVMAPRGDAYLTPFLLGFRARADLERFIDALRAVIARHDILRTAIHWEGLSAPVQVVLRDAALAVEEVELGASDDAVRALRERYDPRGYRIDLTRAPLLRGFTARDEAHDRVLLLLMTHHVVLDHTSLAVVLHEIGEIAAGRERALAEPEPFRTFVAEARLGMPDVEHEAFFRALLGDVDEPTAPFGVTGAARDDADVREARVALEPLVSRRVRACASALGVGPATFFHLVWALVLAHAAGRDDVVFGTLLFGRMQSGEGARPTLGLFVNTLPLRVKLDRSASVSGALRAVHASLADAIRHEGASLALAQRCGGVPAPAPLFSALFNFRQSPPGDAASGAADAAGAELLFAQERTDYPLAVAVDDRTDDFLVTVQADAPVDADFVCASFTTVTANLIALLERDPHARLGSVGVLPPETYARVTADANRTDAAFPQGTLHALFAEQAARTPDATAVTDEAESVTYAELAGRVDALANVLAARGIGRHDVVGVALPRSVATVTALYAILAAGAVYLPLDPASPVERLAQAIADADAALVLTTTGVELGASRVPSLDLAAALVERAPERTPVAADPRDPAYVIFTSGSTGKPKGVAVPHAAAVNLAFARRGHDPIGPGDRVLAAISVGFDVSIGQLALPLLAGATVVIASDLRTMAPAEFWAFLETHGVTHVNSVPSFFESVLAAAPARSSLVRLMLGGEALSLALVRRLRRALPRTQIVNMYGPTEACIDATFHVVDGAESGPFVPIGRPLPNDRAYVLDARLEPVAPGVAGDLYLAGAGLAHGYVGAAALTAERFVADPFGGPGERLYRTGDRARRSADGELEFLGRADTQVKIRGHRVELGEIEARLAAHPGVREAVALVREDVAGDPRLVAYYTAAAGELRADDLRAALASALPDYMIPGAFVRLATLPLTPNGKLDRAALPAPDEAASVRRPYVAPEGETEEAIARVFAAVVGVPTVGRHDDFFELGGHSLLAMTLIERLRADGVPIDVRALFAAPTVAALAVAARDAGALVAVPPNLLVTGTTEIDPAMLPLVHLSHDDIAGIVARVPGGAANVQDVYPLAPLQEGILFRHLLSERGDAYLAPFLLGFDRRDRLDAFLDALREMIVRHDILRTAIVWEGLPEPVQVVLREAELPVEVVALTEDEALDAARALRERYDSRHYRIDVGRAPMLRAFIARDAANDRELLLLLSHHLILDHASLETILREVALVSAGRRDDLPPTTPFREFIARTRLGTPAAEHEAFFRERLGDVREPTLPYGLEAVRGDGGGIREGRLAFDATLSRRLRDRARRLGVSPAAILHLAWALVLAHTAGRDDVVFGTLLFGRMQGGGAGTLGMFINTLPIRVRRGTSDVASAVLDVHRDLAALLRHEHASLALAGRCSGVAAPAPLFSALFNFRQSPPGDAARAWPGVELLFAQERTDYPLSLAVDDRTTDFLVTALADAPVDPDDVCALFETSVRGILAALAGDGPARVNEIDVVPAAMRDRVLVAPNATTAAFPPGTLYASFAAQAARTPDAIAVTQAGTSLSYEALLARVDAFAGALGPHVPAIGTVVGVALPRSIGTVVSLLAILKCGGVYLPLDVAYPPDRIAFTIADAGAACVIADATTRTLVPPRVVVLDFDAASPDRADPVRSRDPARVTPEDTAYLIYTSGSTGKPKGVAVPHRAAVNLAYARLGHDPIGPGDRILAAISVGFDVSIGQVLLPLLSGATVVIADDMRTLSARDFWTFVAGERVTHVNSVPSFFESILDDAPSATSLVRVMLGGEALSGALVRRLERALPGVEIVNMYGPTEACIDATYRVACAGDDAGVVPIGVPLPNARAYVLDARLEPVAVGVAGELHLGGAGLAHGYAGRAALTAERFIADPFGPPGARLYRTGDRVRWNAAGELEFIGRADGQVKIRGHRVELGEIEAALRDHPAVASAAVVARTSRGASATLAAYVTAREGVTPPGAGDLRAHLASRLPEYMVPAAFATLADIPRTPNGKLDAAALPEIAREAAADAPAEPPRTDTERVLVELFAETLGVTPAGRDDDFFALGGHSLAAIRLITAIGTRFARTLPLRVLFERPTIAGLAAAIDDDVSVTDGILVPLRASGARRPLFCVHPAGGHVFCYLPLVRALPPDQPVYGLQAPALDGEHPLAPSIEAMAEDYVRALRAVQPGGPYRLLGMSSGGLVAYEMARRLRDVGETVELLALLDTSVPGALEPFDEATLVRGVAGEFGVADLVDEIPEPPTIAAVLERAHALRRLPDTLDRVLADRVAAVFRNTVRACEAYRPAPWNGPFLIVRAIVRERAGDAMPDWSRLAGAHASTIDLDATHADLMAESLAPTIASLVEPHLRKT